MNSPTDPIFPQTENTRDRREHYLFSSYPTLYSDMAKLAVKYRFYDKNNAVYDVLREVKEMIEEKFVLKDKVRAALSKAERIEKENNKLRYEKDEIKKELSKTRAILKLLRINSRSSFEGFVNGRKL